MSEIEYTIKQLAELAGVSTRTLRYYDTVGLLKPSYLSPANYRIYEQDKVEQLQQILFFRELDFSLAQIKALLPQSPADYLSILQDHQLGLLKKQARLTGILATVEQSIAAAKGEIIMSNQEKFAAFKQELVNTQEKEFGTEARATYGADAVDGSQQKMLQLTEGDYQTYTELEAQIIKILKTETKIVIPSDNGAKLFNLHKDWLNYTWETYTPIAHQGLAQIYLTTPAFTEYYDSRAGVGATERLVAVINHYTK